MTAKCVTCGLSWNVSILHKIPRTGYTCPRCDSRRKDERRYTDSIVQNTSTAIAK